MQFFIGGMYYLGDQEGVPQDDAKAAAWIRLAAAQGDAHSQFVLGGMYEKGEGVPQDDAEAIAWYRRAAEQGHAEAQYNLGRIYDRGMGAPPDDAEAATWYRQASEQNLFAAQSALGWMYEQGRGVPQDNVEAHRWYNLAAAQLTSEQREQAVTARDRVAEQMTPVDLIEAQRRAREWHAAHQVP